ncbi:unnamed protein product [Rotaria sordida]|uniref:Uncharacterized protein n=1 Tax=Rotaria sordida TaxID=392033 RepID=A0A815Y1G4_9BILA|nr:unnamed protein product [Rotaria sordida]CAF1678537.1 unnamed protein product [Rotaria sordida]
MMILLSDLYITNRLTTTLLYIYQMMQLFQTNYHLSSIIYMQYEITLDSSYTYMYVLQERCFLIVDYQDGSKYIYNFQTGEILKQLTLTSSSLPILSLSLRSDGPFLAYIYLQEQL